MIVNFENDKKALEEQVGVSAEANKSLLNEIAQKKAEIENIENYIIALQDLMSEAYVQKETLEKECETLEVEYNKKKILTETIGKLFKKLDDYRDTKLHSLSVDYLVALLNTLCAENIIKATARLIP